MTTASKYRATPDEQLLISRFLISRLTRLEKGRDTMKAAMRSDTTGMAAKQYQYYRDAARAARWMLSTVSQRFDVPHLATA